MYVLISCLYVITLYFKVTNTSIHSAIDIIIKYTVLACPVVRACMRYSDPDLYVSHTDAVMQLVEQLYSDVRCMQTVRKTFI